ncbi:ribonuclease HII [uncultured Methanomethylovorans sp.]|uniref:ribonuclease HII n=1 Tax=uncultured Methanomethylovorans sp. TaxID=183759 RepID=UPI002AA73B6D|nr:ribonuclease HII [uncultured Methanomethylovorans sp.]
MKIAGIDEAGKGPVIGPMCIGGVLADKEKLDSLKNLGVADSKKLAPKKREHLAHQIRKYAQKVYIFEVSPSQIDELRKVMTMNQIMVLGFSRVLEELQPDMAYVDAADVNATRFGTNLKAQYAKKYPEKANELSVVSEHQADATYPVVSAASIVAKVRRDELIKELGKKIGIDFGSGYPSDPKTQRFLEDWSREHDTLPEFVRHSWKTAENVLKRK